MDTDQSGSNHQDSTGNDEASTQINHIAPGRGSNSDLTHDEKEKSQAALYIRHTFGPAVKRAGAKANAGSSGASGGVSEESCTVGALNGWDTKKGLQNCADEWDRQMTQLVNRLFTEASTLEGANVLFRGNEDFNAARFKAGRDGYRSPIDNF
ncbi:hypothetical protein [Streptomyces oceani]|uniref:hypothetical protein n=1 Tax=Streptomyces oceani TaxID=1075402 RepID=UPI001112D197|nr:hypothetical protein [Streptomyces oceani]